MRVERFSQAVRRLSEKRERELVEMRRALLDWYAAHARDLPWRRTRDPYRIMVSEVMLQQTQVDRVIPKYEVFIRELPTVGDLARVDTQTLLRLWQGLGYHRRALNLRKAAQVIVKEYHGVFPRTPEELERLPGIGKYTAAAIASFAFDYPIAVYDTNVRRVLARLTGVHDEAFLREEAQRVLAKEESRAWNNAMMELGSLVCVKGMPKCKECPLREWCVAFATKRFDTPAVPRQSKYEGSWRQYRARLLRVLSEQGMLPLGEVREAIGLPEKWRVEDLVKELEEEGFLVVEEDQIRLA